MYNISEASRVEEIRRCAWGGLARIDMQVTCVPAALQHLRDDLSRPKRWYKHTLPRSGNHRMLLRRRV